MAVSLVTEVSAIPDRSGTNAVVTTPDARVPAMMSQKRTRARSSTLMKATRVQGRRSQSTTMAIKSAVIPQKGSRA